MKRVVSVIVSFIVALCPLAPFVCAKEYTDKNSEYSGATDFVTREQAIACFVEAVGMERFKTDAKILDRFKDKDEVSYAYIDEMSAAVYSGLINGYEDNTLRPQGEITRIEALVILNRALSRTELTDWYDVEFVDTPQWAKKQVERLAAAGIVKGYGDGRLGATDGLTIIQVNTLCQRIERITGPMGDFYNYVNADWLEETELADGVYSKSEIGELEQTVNSDITDIIFSLYRRFYNDGEKFEDNSNERKIITVYSAAANQSYRDKIGIEPIQPILNSIDGAKNINDILKVMAELEKNGFPTLIRASFDPDLQGEGRYLPAVAGSYTGMDCNLYRAVDSDRNISVYKTYLESLFKAANVADPKVSAENAVSICKRLAEAVSLTARVDLGQVVKPYDKAALKKIYGNIDIMRYFSDIGFSRAENIIVYDEPLARTAAEILKDVRIEDIKAYLKASVLDSSALYLNTDIFNAYQAYQNALNGDNFDNLPSDYATGITQDLLGWELGEIYIERYFSENSKLLVDEMTAKIIDEYEKLIKTSTRMTPNLKSGAIEKLRGIKIYSAYPDNIEEYSKSDIVLKPIEDGGNLMQYKMAYANEYINACADAFNKKKPINSGWQMCPQTVNAMYDHITNSITIPAGMLQPPFFEASAEFEENLGGIGVVIAHEISHAFDATGAQFDKNGKLANWWNEQDKAAFDVLCREIVEQYGNIRVGDLYIDGEFTLNENLADLAALSCVINLAGDDNPNIGKLFENYAKVWRIKTTEEYDNILVQTDVHSPNKVRVNRGLSNFSEFELFYDIVDGDGMYIPDENKIDIWR